MFGWHPAITVGVIYALMISVLGFADYRLRLSFARFAIGVVRDVRAVVIRGIGRLRRVDPERTSGDLVTRLIGDSARLKAGLKGFLIHVATNGLLFVGISGVLLWMEWSIGLIFLSASILTVVVTAISASEIFRRAIKYRHKESKIANTISDRLALHRDEEDDEEMEGDPLRANRSSGRYEASITRIQGLTTWVTHLILAIALPTALWRSFQAVTEGLIDPGDLFIVMLYALMILGPMVRLTRQGARCGKILANADRLVDLLESTATESTVDFPTFPKLQQCISLENVRLRSQFNGTKRRWFGPMTLQIKAGEKTAILGAPGTGKTTLFTMLAGQRPYKGNIRWDGHEISQVDFSSLCEQIAYVEQDPVWPSLEASGVMGELTNSKPGEPLSVLLKQGGFKSLRSRLKKHGDDKIRVEDVSHSERKFLALVRFRTSSHSLKLIDDPVGEIPSKKAARKFLSAFLTSQHEGQTVVVTLDRPVALKHFDRVIVLEKKGDVAFDGSPDEWKAIQKATQEKP